MCETKSCMVASEMYAHAVGGAGANGHCPKKRLRVMVIGDEHRRWWGGRKALRVQETNVNREYRRWSKRPTLTRFGALVVNSTASCLWPRRRFTVRISVCRSNAPSLTRLASLTTNECAQALINAILRPALYVAGGTLPASAFILPKGSLTLLLTCLNHFA